MNIRTRKVLRDIWGNKARTALVIASIAVGLMAISTTFRARSIFSQNLAADLAAIEPASATLVTLGANEQTVSAVKSLAAVADASGQKTLYFRIQLEDGWRTLKLVAFPDFTDIPIDKIAPVSGDWPPPAHTLLLERSSLGATGFNLHDTVMIESPAGRRQPLPISGLVHDLNIVSGELLDQVIFGYVSLETLQWLGLSPDFNEIKITITGDRLDEAAIRRAVREAGDTIEEEGLPLLGSTIPAPGRHLMNNVIQSLLLIMGSLGALSLLLSAFLVFNTVSALLVRQVPQIGVMKAIGAPRRDILLMYLSTIFIFSALALLLAVPLGMAGSRLMTLQMARLLNFDVNSFQVPLQILLLELSIGLLIPLAAALAPILNGAGITVREAISRQGAGDSQFGSGLIDRWLGRLRGLPATASYAARNIFRRKTRLLLTLLTLSLGGSIFITVLSVRDSLFVTIDGIAAYWQQDVTVNFQQLYRLAELQPALQALPQVAQLEGWSAYPAFLLRDDQESSTESITLFALPPDSHFLTPTLLSGRWLTNADTDAMVINIDLATQESDVELGRRVRLRVNGRESEWHVVGIVTTQMIGVGEPRPEIPMAYVAYSGYADSTGEAGLVNRLAVAAAAHDVTAQIELSRALEAQLQKEAIRVSSVETNSNTRRQVENLTMPVLLLLLFMAALFALVGGLSLTGTMSLNVLERTQEIGIIRAIGASSRHIMQIVIAEGVFVGLLSWLLAALLAYPLGLIMSAAVGVSFIKVPLTYRFAPTGILLWLLLVIILAIIASYVPARNASRLIVRQALAYE